ncbi:hypothetical protein V3C99_012681 [Haemonchus contortus]
MADVERARSVRPTPGLPSPHRRRTGAIHRRPCAGRGSSGNAEGLGLATGVYSVTSIGEGVATEPMSASSDSSNKEEPRSDASRSDVKGSLSRRHETAAVVLSTEYDLTDRCASTLNDQPRYGLENVRGTCSYT